MKPNVKMGFNALFLIGLIFTIFGTFFTVVGIIICFFIKEIIFLICFSGIGVIFLSLGIVFLIFNKKKINAAKKAVESGYYIMAEIVEVCINTSVVINGRCPYVIVCKYEDPYGVVHMFESRNIFYDPSSMLKDTHVRVYVDKDNYENNYVDIDSVLPIVEKH